MKAKKPSTYAEDMRWVGERLYAGDRVWCVRMAESGMIVRFLACPEALAHEVEAITAYEGTPVELLRVHPMYLGREDGGPHFGPETLWPGRKA